MRPANLHWSERPTVSKKTVMVGVHCGAQPRHIRLIDNVRPVWRKWRPDRHYDPHLSQPGGAQTPLPCARAVRPFPMVGTRPFHTPHGSSSCDTFIMSLAALPVSFTLSGPCRQL